MGILVAYILTRYIIECTRVASLEQPRDESGSWL